ncbi:hypothetical protein ACFOJ6_02390 [Gordonia humi]|uniref:hypothetical protein n=1 Tax=Gordonia humi TaxID=686429 RepID=UPI00360F63DD
MPAYFSWFARSIVHPWDGVFAIATPAVETVLGIALILGILTLPSAVAGIGLLLTYWLADQLIAQYPIMAALAVVVILVPSAAARYSAPRLCRSLRRMRRGRDSRPVGRRDRSCGHRLHWSRGRHPRLRTVLPRDQGGPRTR